MEGILSVNELHGRNEHRRARTINQVNQYANNFSKVADFVDLSSSENTGEAHAMFDLMNAIKKKANENLEETKL